MAAKINRQVYTRSSFTVEQTNSAALRIFQKRHSARLALRGDDCLNRLRQSLIILIAHLGHRIVGIQLRHDIVVARLLADIAVGNVVAHVLGEGAAGNGPSRTGRCQQIARKLPARYRQLTCVVGGIKVSVLQRIVTLGLKSTAVNRCNIIILHRRLGNIGNQTVIDHQLSVIIIFDCIDSSAERTAVDGQLGLSLVRPLHITRTLISFCVTIIPIGNQAGKRTVLLHGNALIDGHNAVVEDVIIRIPAGILRRISVLLAAGILAAIQRHSTVIENSRFPIADIINRPRTVDRQFAAQFNINRVFCLFGGVVSNGIFIQVKNKLVIARNNNIFRQITNQLYACLSAIQGIRNRLIIIVPALYNIPFAGTSCAFFPAPHFISRLRPLLGVLNRGLRIRRGLLVRRSRGPFVRGFIGQNLLF